MREEVRVVARDIADKLTALNVTDITLRETHAQCSAAIPTQPAAALGDEGTRQLCRQLLSNGRVARHGLRNPDCVRRQGILERGAEVR